MVYLDYSSLLMFKGENVEPTVMFQPIIVHFQKRDHKSNGNRLFLAQANRKQITPPISIPSLPKPLLSVSNRRQGRPPRQQLKVPANLHSLLLF